MIKIGDKYKIINANEMCIHQKHNGKIAEVVNKDRYGSFGIIIDNGLHVDYSIDDYMVTKGHVERVLEEVKQSTGPLDFNSQVMLTIDDHYTEFRDSTWQGLLEHFLDALGEAGFMYDESHLRRKKAILSIANTGKIEI
jgi:hypothetical protein